MASIRSVVEWRRLFNGCRAFRRVWMLILNIAILPRMFCCGLLAFNPKWKRCSEDGPHFAACRWGAGCTHFTHDSLTLLSLRYAGLCFDWLCFDWLCFEWLCCFFAPAFSLLTLFRQWSCHIAGQEFCASIFITSSTLLHWCMRIVRCRFFNKGRHSYWRLLCWPIKSRSIWGTGVTWLFVGSRWGLVRDLWCGLELWVYQMQQCFPSIEQFAV